MNRSRSNPLGTLAALLDALDAYLDEKLQARRPDSPTHYSNGPAACLPPGYTAARFLRQCREWQRSGELSVGVDGKLRRVRVADFDVWLMRTAATPRLALVKPVGSASEAIPDVGGSRTGREERAGFAMSAPPDRELYSEIVATLRQKAVSSPVAARQLARLIDAYGVPESSASTDGGSK